MFLFDYVIMNSNNNDDNNINNSNVIAIKPNDILCQHWTEVSWFSHDIDIIV